MCNVIREKEYKLKLEFKSHDFAVRKSQEGKSCTLLFYDNSKKSLGQIQKTARRQLISYSPPESFLLSSHVLLILRYSFQVITISAVSSQIKTSQAVLLQLTSTLTMMTWMPPLLAQQLANHVT